jgi:hypothetical protein
VIRVGGSVSAGTMTVRAYMNPSVRPVGYDTDEANYMFKWEDTTDGSADIQWIIQDNGHSQITDAHRQYLNSARKSFVYTEYDSSRPESEMVMLRLSIYAKINSGSYGGTLYAVSLRETVY